jgi:septation ring formation regulator EzrA
MAKVITRYLRYIDELYQMIENCVDMTKVDKSQLEKIRRKYKKYKRNTGAEIKGVHYISRDEPVHSIYENADFSPKAIKDSIREGELKTNKILDEIPKTKKGMIMGDRLEIQPTFYLSIIYIMLRLHIRIFIFDKIL